MPISDASDKIREPLARAFDAQRTVSLTRA
jgi:hypothetical protein